MSESKVFIPDDLYNRLEEHLPQTSFTDLNDFVTYILEEYLDNHEAASAEDEDIDESEEITRRLKNLGYL